MKKKYWKCGILAAVLLCILFGCGKQNHSEEDEKAEKAEELIIVDGNSEDTEQTEEPLEIPEPAVLEDLGGQLETVLLQGQSGGMAAVYVENLTTGDYVSISNQQMQSASLIKLFIAGCVYEHLGEVQAQESYEGETEELMRMMITVSDNDAANTLTTRLGQGNAAAGRAEVNQFCQNHGYAETYMGRMLLDFTAAEDNYTSADDCGSFMKAIYRQELAGSESILAYMKQQERTGKLPAGVPEGVMTANKTGELTDVENDAAIVFTDTGAYSICVMMSGLPDAAAGRSVIRELSSVTYQYMVGGN